ncbi:hypothetical protein JVT61DRAFT_10658 [Boletus reticuloceps]|uniref:CHAT domain-containing protein n=1 Tax=Boletus reticuloceps TaxID=495285 RepID=A0A8I3A4V7_9AGAM|nr:hypothetical protein JVT61DRAFT_10658 [Boletus reticuloceps]
MNHRSLLHAYSIALNLLPQVAWIGLSLTHRYAELKRGADVVREAAAAALDSGFPELAVEWLEQGRSIVWGELLQLRGSYEQLSSAHPDHAHRLRNLSTALDDAGATREKSLSTFSESTDGATHGAIQTLQEEADRHRTLAIERDKLLQEIRRLPGFERFLLPKDFSQLHASAHSGPVVMLNAAEHRCDALIVLADVDHVIHVPLPHFTFKRAADHSILLKTFLRQAHAIRSDERYGMTVTWDRGSWESFLAPLWNGIVKPVLDALAFSVRDLTLPRFTAYSLIGVSKQSPGDISRIFWCPTGPFVFLPIHAAGFYDSQYSLPGHKVFDFAVSSYVPTLSILARSPTLHAVPNDDLRLLAVRQPPSDGLGQLPGVAPEIAYIKDVIRDSPSAHTTILESSLGTVEEVLGLMKEANWVHFACHGIQDGVDSGLCLADKRRLTLRDMLSLSRPDGGLAFLSACQTATGDEDLSDEAVHIAAGMLFAGYGGVVVNVLSSYASLLFKLHCVYAFNRPSSIRSIEERQRSAFKGRGLQIDPLESNKLVYIEADASQQKCGLSPAQYEEVRNSVTAILHNAWRLDFNLAISSFEDSIRVSRNLIDLCLDSPPTQNLRFLITSSIGSAQGWDNSKRPFPEEVQLDPSIAAGTGYGEGKYATVRVSCDATANLIIVTEMNGQIIVESGLHATYLRIGKIAGGHGGSWATTDWFPILVKSSVALGALPEAVGSVSWLREEEMDSAILEPAIKLLDFFRALAREDEAIQRMGVGPTEAGGMTNFSTPKVREVSATMANMQAIGEVEADAWVGYWIAKGAL